MEVINDEASDFKLWQAARLRQTDPLDFYTDEFFRNLRQGEKFRLHQTEYEFFENKGERVLKYKVATKKKIITRRTRMYRKGFVIRTEARSKEINQFRKIVFMVEEEILSELLTMNHPAANEPGEIFQIASRRDEELNEYVRRHNARPNPRGFEIG